MSQVPQFFTQPLFIIPQPAADVQKATSLPRHSFPAYKPAVIQQGWDGVLGNVVCQPLIEVSGSMRALT